MRQQQQQKMENKRKTTKNYAFWVNQS